MEKTSQSSSINPEITPNSFLTIVTPSISASHSSTHNPNTLLFFIPGNPGLVSYYHLFLSLLAKELGNGNGNRNGDGDGDGDGFVICARSMGGFEVGLDESEDGRLYGLSEQIGFVEGQLRDVVGQVRDGDCQNGRVKVVLMGHSVGAYVAMEILRRWRDGRTIGEKKDGADEMDVIGGIMLFPTVVDIAKSASGRKLTVCIWDISIWVTVADFAPCEADCCIAWAILTASFLDAAQYPLSRLHSQRGCKDPDVHAPRLRPPLGC